MKIAVMQPYFFPYIGYFELMASVDKFVFLTDVQYIRQGWVNRNRLRSKNKNFQYLTVPVIAHPRSSNIMDILSVPGWMQQHIEILNHTYGFLGKHPLYQYYVGLNHYSSLSDMLCNSLIWTARYLGINCEFALSNDISNKKGSAKIIDICRKFGADTYVNLSGGKELYKQEFFDDIFLKFMQPTVYENNFSILDVIFTEEEKLKNWISIQYKII